MAAYSFTTLTAIPGVLEYGGAEIQILDLPGIIEGASEGKGRGRQVISAAKVSHSACSGPRRCMVPNDVDPFVLLCYGHQQLILQCNANLHPLGSKKCIAYGKFSFEYTTNVLT